MIIQGLEFLNLLEALEAGNRQLLLPHTQFYPQLLKVKEWGVHLDQQIGNCYESHPRSAQVRAIGWHLWFQKSIEITDGHVTLKNVRRKKVNKRKKGYVFFWYARGSHSEKVVFCFHWVKSWYNFGDHYTTLPIEGGQSNLMEMLLIILCWISLKASV